MSIEAIICIVLAILLCGSIYVLITRNDVSNSSALSVAKDASDLSHLNEKSVSDLRQSQKDFVATQVELLSKLTVRVDYLEREPKNIRVSLPKAVTFDVVERPKAIAISQSVTAPKVKPLIPTSPLLDRAGVRKQRTSRANN